MTAEGRGRRRSGARRAIETGRYRQQFSARNAALAAALLATLVAAGCKSARPVASGGPLGLATAPSAANPTAAAVPRAAPRGILQALLSPRAAPARRPHLSGEVPKADGRYHLGKPYRIGGKWFEPAADPSYDEVGVASFYGRAFHGRRTANGEIFDMNGLSAAHPTLPLPSYVRVTNLDNDRSVIVRVNDRGPFKRGRVIDVSRRAADMLGFVGRGTTRVRVQFVDVASLDGNDAQYLVASYRGQAVPSVQPRGTPPPTATVLATAPAARPPGAATPAITGSLRPAPDPARFDPFASAATSHESGFVGPDPGAAAFEPAESPGWSLASIFRASFAGNPPRIPAFAAISRLIDGPS